MPRLILIVAFFLVQMACAFFFVYDIVVTVLGLPVAPMNWQSRELMEIGAAIGLVMGVCLGGIVVLRTIRSSRLTEQRLRAASGAFMEMVAEHFSEWGLTPAERDVALFAVKGLSTAEIAQMRATSEGTVKAQTNAIYRKAGVSGRAQLLGLFIEELIGEALPGIEPAKGASGAGLSESL